MELISLSLLLFVGVLGGIDAIYFHLWKFRLYARPQSRREHVTHAIRALLVAPTVGLLFVWPAVGVTLWLVVALMVTDFAVMIWDLIEEPNSRRDLGGVPPMEAALHVVASTLHGAAYAFALASRPVAAWSQNATPIAVSSGGVSTLAALILPGAALLGVAHLVLLHRRFGRALRSEHR